MPAFDLLVLVLQTFIPVLQTFAFSGDAKLASTCVEKTREKRYEKFKGTPGIFFLSYVGGSWAYYASQNVYHSENFNLQSALIYLFSYQKCLGANSKPQPSNQDP